MKISDRLTDYGLIGGFFWVLQFSLWGFFGFSGLTWNTSFIDTVKGAIPSEFVPAFVALLGALAIITIFTTGLLLDLLGATFFRNIESEIFKKHLLCNELWLKKLIDKNTDYMRDDWSKLVTSSWFNLNIDNQFEVWRAYRRFQSFLLVYVLLSGVEKIELLATQISLWSTSRAIATAMALGSLVPLIMLIYDPLLMRSQSYLLVLGVQIALTGISVAVSRSAYQRVLSTLFALAYIIASRATGTSPVELKPST